MNEGARNDLIQCHCGAWRSKQAMKQHQLKHNLAQQRQAIYGSGKAYKNKKLKMRDLLPGKSMW